MKARVKSTGTIVDVVCNFEEKTTLANGHTIELKSYTDGSKDYYGHQLDFNVEDVDYWTKLKHKAMIAAMHGIMNCPTWNIRTKYDERQEDMIAKMAEQYADALISRIKNNQ